MSWPFRRRSADPDQARGAPLARPIDAQGRRVIGLTLEERRPIFEPNDQVSSIVYAATGGGKTTRVAVPAIQALLSDPKRAIIINDVKRGEIAAQIAPMCQKYGRSFGVIDDCKVLGEDYPYRLSVNPFSPIVQAHKRQHPELPFLIETALHTLIPEPKGAEGGQDRNFYWRESPRQYGATALRALLAHPHLSTPGGLADLVGDPEMFMQAMRLLAGGGSDALRGRALPIIETAEKNPELHAQHSTAIQTALKLFAEAPLHEAGYQASHTHEDLLKENWVICIVSPTQHLERLAPWFALHFNALMDVQLSGAVGKSAFIIDEFCAAPLEPALRRITVQRAFKSRLILLTQSRKDAVRQYGEDFTSVLEENCLVKQYMKVSQFDEAERLSKAIGESLLVQQSLNLDAQKVEKVGVNYGLARQRHLSPAELMALPDDQQIVHLAGFGFLRCYKIGQHQIAPYCDDLAPNPLEGGILPPDPHITLTTPPPIAAGESADPGE